MGETDGQSVSRFLTAHEPN